MNVGHPSNIARIISLYGGVMDETGKIIREPDLAKMREDMFAVAVTDEETKSMIKTAWEKYHLLLEPHGSVGWSGLMKYFEDTPEDAAKDQVSVSLETAHPAKFPAEVKEILGVEPDLPRSLEGLESLEEKFEYIENDYNSFKDYLRNNY